MTATAEIEETEETQATPGPRTEAGPQLFFSQISTQMLIPRIWTIISVMTMLKNIINIVFITFNNTFNFTTCFYNDDEIIHSISNTKSIDAFTYSESNQNVKLCNVMSWNIQGLRPKLCNPEFREFCNNFDIFSLSEIQNCTEKEMRDTFFEYEVFISKRTK